MDHTQGDREAARDLADKWIPQLREAAVRVRNGGLTPQRGITEATNLFCQALDVPIIDVDALLQICEALEGNDDRDHVGNALQNMAVMVKQYAAGELQDEG